MYIIQILFRFIRRPIRLASTFNPHTCLSNEKFTFISIIHSVFAFLFCHSHRSIIFFYSSSLFLFLFLFQLLIFIFSFFSYSKSYLSNYLSIHPSIHSSRSFRFHSTTPSLYLSYLFLLCFFHLFCRSFVLMDAQLVRMWYRNVST